MRLHWPSVAVTVGTLAVGSFAVRLAGVLYTDRLFRRTLAMSTSRPLEMFRRYQGDK